MLESGTNNIDYTPADLNALAARLPENSDPIEFLRKIEELQGACPWKDLIKKEGMIDLHERMPEFGKRIPYAPIVLAIGGGRPCSKKANLGTAQISDCGLFINSDTIHPYYFSDNYLHMDLTDASQISLLGNKVHAITSIGVFTYDDFGVEFKNSTNEMDCAAALCDLLMPGGIIANHNIFDWNQQFEEILEENFGFKRVYEGHADFILQKPF